MPAWWDRLNRKEQLEYLDDHPESKLKPTAEDQGTYDDSETNTGHARKGVLSYIKNNPGKFALAAISTLTAMNTRYDRDIEGMSPKRRSVLAHGIRTAIHLKDSKALRDISYKVGVSTGVLLIGATVFSALTGMNVALAVPVLATNFWSRIKSAPDDLEYLKNVGKAYVDTVKDNLEDEKVVSKAVKSGKPDVEVEVDDDEEVDSTADEKVVEKGSAVRFTIPSGHETDLNKTMSAIEKAKLTEVTHRLLAKKPTPQTVLKHMSSLENTIPVLASIIVASIPLRGNLSRRANSQISMLSEDFRRCGKELANLASTQSSAKTPVGSKLGKLLNTKIQSHQSYVQVETGSVQLCEVHSVSNLEVGGSKYNHVTFYTYKDSGSLCIAHTINSYNLPKAFDTIKISNLDAWLKTNKFLG